MRARATRAWLRRAAVMLAISLTASPGLAAQALRQSGVVASVDRAAGTLVLGEVGPWTVKDGQTVVTMRTVTLTPDTTVVLVERGDQATSGFAGDFVTVPRSLDAIAAGAFVTVECRPDARGCTAAKITLVAPGAR